MEAIMIPSSPDQSISPYNNKKHMKNPKRNARHFISRSIENFAAPNYATQNGLLITPPPPPPRPLSYSFPPPSFSLVNSNNLHQQQQQQQQQKPPLLPLPITKPYSSLPSRTRGLSCSPTNNKAFNRSIKKSKPSSSSTSPKKDDSKKDFNSRKDNNATTKDVTSECLIIASTNRLGPDPNDLPKDVSRVLPSSVDDGVISCTVLTDLKKFSGSVFTLSPPPSSLPLPKFSLRPKLGCNAEAAAGFDAGATDNLRRLLRLR